MNNTSTESLSSDYLYINSCGCQKLYNVDKGSYRPNGRIDYHILYITEGCCYVTINDKILKAPAGSIVIFPPYQKQEYNFYKSDRSTSYYIHFTGTACAQLIKEVELSDKNIYYIGKSVALERLLNTLIEEFQQKLKYNKYRLQGLLLDIISLIGRKNSNMLYGNPDINEKFADICKYMHSNLSKNLSVSDYAKMFNFSESRFSHLFAEIIGISPKHYLLILRIETAKELLINSELSILQISESIGIFDQNYFSKIFRKYTNHSPTEYRKLH